LWRDDALLLDMLNASTDAVSFTAEIDQPQFHASRLHQYAVIRCLTVIGEAASRVSREFRNQHPEIEWQAIVGMRHCGVHKYGAIKLDVVSGAVHTKLPELIAILQPLIPPDDDTKST
jgi:uncharacterized protein with HEPN domain